MKKILSSYLIFTMVFGTAGFLPASVLAKNDNENTKVNICHQTSSETNTWVAQNISESSLDTHLEHGDFLYNGPIDDEKPDNTDGQADLWCENNASETPVDICSNLEGNQAEIPEGYEMNESNLCVEIVPDAPTATLIATKIVCNSETDLPNFGNGININGTTATDFVASNPNCHLASGWNFEWAPDGTPNPGSSMIGSAGSPWTTFGATLVDGTTSTMIPAGALIWVREVMKAGFVGYSDDIGEPLPENPVSAEFYCTTDGVNYDNYDWIDSVIAGDTYHCVAFNAPTTQVPPTDVCSNIDGNQTSVPQGMIANEGQCLPIPPAPTATLNATKIVCDSEADLPNWGAGAEDIDGTTASAFLEANPNCHPQKDWSFQWSLEGVPNPGDNVTDENIANWTTFGHTDTNGSVSTQIPANENVRVREVFNSNYVPFTGENTVNDISAEIYCDTDVMNYDNWDFIDNVLPGVTYHCIAFNAPIVEEVQPVDVCSNIDGNQTSVPQGMVSEQGQCFVPEDGIGGGDPIEDVCLNIDGVQTEVPNGKVLSGDNCVDPSTTTETPACSSNCGNENVGGNSGGGNNPPAANGPIVGSFAGTTGGVGGGQVLGESCGIYLNDYLRYGKKNSPEEVEKLQKFLNEYMGLNLNVSGFFDIATFEAVSKFQAKEDAEVLQPWVKLGLLKQGETTGYVFKTTKRRINLIKCAELNIPIPNLLSN